MSTAASQGGDRVSATTVGLRRWAEGCPADAAAVELLALVAGGRLLTRSSPWVRPCGRLGWFWLDPRPLAKLEVGLRGRDQRLVALAVALLRDTQVERPCPRTSAA